MKTVTVDALMALPVCDPWGRPRVEEAAKRWPKDVTILWIVEHGSAPPRDRVSLAVQWLARYDRDAVGDLLRHFGACVNLQAEVETALRQWDVSDSAEKSREDGCRPHKMLTAVSMFNRYSSVSLAYKFALKAIIATGLPIERQLEEIAAVLRSKGER